MKKNQKNQKNKQKYLFFLLLSLLIIQNQNLLYGKINNNRNDFFYEEDFFYFFEKESKDDNQYNDAIILLESIKNLSEWEKYNNFFESLKKAQLSCQIEINDFLIPNNCFKWLKLKAKAKTKTKAKLKTKIKAKIRKEISTKKISPLLYEKYFQDLNHMCKNNLKRVTSLKYLSELLNYPIFFSSDCLELIKNKILKIRYINSSVHH